MELAKLNWELWIAKDNSYVLNVCQKNGRLTFEKYVIHDQGKSFIYESEYFEEYSSDVSRRRF